MENNENTADQLNEIRESIRGLDRAVSSILHRHDHHKHGDLDKFHIYGTPNHHYPSEIEVTHVDGRYDMSKIIKTVYKTVDKKLHIRVPRDEYRNQNTLYFIHIPVGLSETCISKYHTCKCRKDCYTVAQEMFFEMINRSRNIHLDYRDFDIGLPKVIEHDKIYNTEVTISPKKRSAYHGDITIRYRRKDINELFRLYTPTEDTSSRYLSEVLDKLGIPLFKGDYIDQELPVYDPNTPHKPRYVTIKAKESSLFYCNTTTICLNYKKVYFNPNGCLEDMLVQEDGCIRTPEELSKAQDIVIVIDGKVHIFRDMSVIGGIGYHLEDVIDNFTNTMLEYEDVYVDPDTGESHTVTKNSYMRIDSIFKINNDRYVAYGKYDLAYRDKNDLIVRYTGNSVLLDGNFTIMRGEDNLFHSTRYDPSTMIVTDQGEVAVVAEDNGVSCIYLYCSYGHVITTIYIEKNSNIVPVKIYPGKEGSIYVIGTMNHHVYKLYKINRIGSLVPYMDHEGNIYPYNVVLISNVDPNLDPAEIEDIKDDNIGDTYIVLKPKDIGIRDQYTTFNGKRYSIDNLVDPLTFNPVRRIKDNGILDDNYIPYIRDTQADLVSVEHDMITNSLDVRQVVDYGDKSRVSYYTKMKDMLTGVDCYKFLAVDTQGNIVNRYYLDPRYNIIDKVYIYKQLDNGGYAVVCHIVKSYDRTIEDQDAIVVYDKNYATIYTLVITDITDTSVIA